MQMRLIFAYAAKDDQCLRRVATVLCPQPRIAHKFRHRFVLPAQYRVVFIRPGGRRAKADGLHALFHFGQIDDAQNFLGDLIHQRARRTRRHEQAVRGFGPLEFGVRFAERGRIGQHRRALRCNHCQRDELTFLDEGQRYAERARVIVRAPAQHFEHRIRPALVGHLHRLDAGGEIKF